MGVDLRTGASVGTKRKIGWRGPAMDTTAGYFGYEGELQAIGLQDGLSAWS